MKFAHPWARSLHNVPLMPQVNRVTRMGFVNCYLVEEDDGLTLVDTMIPRSAKTIIARAQALGPPIKRIALTDAHLDHIGSVDELVTMLPGVEVMGAPRRSLRRARSA